MKRRYKIYLGIGIALCAALMLHLWTESVHEKKLESLCGSWSAYNVRSKLRITDEDGYYFLTLHRLSPRGRVEVSRHRLLGGRMIHFGEGSERTDVWITQDGQTLCLVPGGSYRRDAIPTN